MSGADHALVRAYARGYRINPDGEVLNPKGAILRGGRNRDGYRWFRVLKTDPPIRIHRLQAFQKFGVAMFAPGLQVRHLDGNKENNRPENIAIGTASENQMDKPADVRLRAAFKAVDAARKHDHAEIVAHLNAGHSYQQTMERFGIRSKGTVSFIARRSMESRARLAASLSHAEAVANLHAEGKR